MRIHHLDVYGNGVKTLKNELLAPPEVLRRSAAFGVRLSTDDIINPKQN
jgi:hypothetical protein